MFKHAGVLLTVLASTVLPSTATAQSGSAQALSATVEAAQQAVPEASRAPSPELLNRLREYAQTHTHLSGPPLPGSASSAAWDLQSRKAPPVGL